MTRVHIVQHPPHLLDLDAGVQTAIQHIALAKQGNADLVVFPETWLGGYPAWIFGMAGWDDSNARAWFLKLVEASPTISSQHVASLCNVAREFEITVIMGFNERARKASATLFNSLVTIGADGRILGVHRKLLPTHTERLVWSRGDGGGLRVYDTPAGRIGGLICWEHWHPIARQALHAQDEQIHIALWPDMSSAHQLASRSYAFEGRCFVVSAATFLPLNMVPATLRDAYAAGVGNEDGFTGGSGVIGPDGEYRVGPVWGDAAVVADIDLSETIAYKHDLDVAGHYDRPDIFEWKVNRPQGADEI